MDTRPDGCTRPACERSLRSGARGAGGAGAGGASSALSAPMTIGGACGPRGHALVAADSAQTIKQLYELTHAMYELLSAGGECPTEQAHDLAARLDYLRQMIQPGVPDAPGCPPLVLKSKNRTIYYCRDREKQDLDVTFAAVEHAGIEYRFVLVGPSYYASCAFSQVRLKPGYRLSWEPLSGVGPDLDAGAPKDEVYSSEWMASELKHKPGTAYITLLNNKTIECSMLLGNLKSFVLFSASPAPPFGFGDLMRLEIAPKS